MEETALISFFPRTEGDGMESMDTPITSDLKSVISTTTESLRGLSVSPVKPPTAERIINLIPKATAPAVVKPKSSAAGDKKAKFVPYEPYKAAVKPIVPIKRKVSNIILEPPHETTPSVKPVPKEWIDTSSSNSMNKLQHDYDKVLREKEELEKQLKINSKVNMELKRLLVASVGEDMEARVHFLTEDKVKLGNDIRQYVEKIALDFEQKERLSIEADIWRSKFLASSVVIEELTKWKSVLCTRNDDLQVCIKGLLDEMLSIQKKHRLTYSHLVALNKAFDPLGNSGRKSPETIVNDVVETSNSILQSAESLSKRLLGTYTQAREDDSVSSCLSIHKLSPAQIAAQEALTIHPIGACSMTEIASDATAQNVAALARRSLNKSFFTCCPHCKGDVHII